MKLAKFTISF